MQSKKISVILTIALIIMIAAALSGCSSSTVSPTPTVSAGGDLTAGLPATMDYSIKVTGGATPVTLTYADLRAMQLKELKGVSVVNSVGTETSGSYVGVPLMDIVNKAGLPAGDVSFTAVAPDGYKIDYTLDQFNMGILALKTDGVANTAGFNDKYPISFVFNGGEKSKLDQDAGEDPDRRRIGRVGCPPDIRRQRHEQADLHAECSQEHDTNDDHRDRQQEQH